MPEQTTLDKIWQAVLGEMELIVGRASFTTWFHDTSIIKIEGGKVTVKVPSAFSKQWLEQKYNKHILDSIRNFCSDAKQVEYLIIASEVKPARKSLPQAQKKSLNGINENLAGHKYSAQEATGINPRYTFFSFIVGGNNALAEAAARAVADAPGGKFNPLFIYGGVGLGKTHLLQAIGNELISKKKGCKAVYITTEDFAKELVNSIRQGKTLEFKEKYRKVDVFLVDDIQFIGGKEKTQEEFFHTFNSLYQRGKQIVICSDRPPKEIATLEERLCSRFEGGMMADISQPDLETRIAILDTKAREKGVEIDQEVLGYIASYKQNNIRELEGILNKFIATCQLQDYDFSVKTAKTVLASEISASQKRSITPTHIVKRVAKFFHLRSDDILGTSRRSEVVKPRQMAIYLMRKEAGLSYPTIGSVFKKDHSTIMHSFNKIKDTIRRDEAANRELNAIRDYLYRRN